MDTSTLIPFSKVLGQLDMEWILSNTERLWKIELGQCFRHYRQAALFAETLLRESGVERVERIVVPADGRTTCLDRTMPLAWDATRGTLTVKQSRVAFDDPVIASYERHPFHLAKGSVSTPPGGITTRLITEQQMYTGEDARGAMVLLEPDAFPSGATFRALGDFGALGFVNDYLVGRYETPDAISWTTTCTEGVHWHVQATDRPRIGFSVSPRTGDKLRTALRKGQVLVHVESDGRLHEGELDIATGLVPGEDARELWVMAHLYEPLPDDNSAGVIGAIEIARTLKRLIGSGALPRPRFTLRLIFAMEMYGYAAYAARRGVPLRNRVLGGINLDGIPVLPTATLILAPPGTPFFGDYLLEQLLNEYTAENYPYKIAPTDRPHYGDDQFLNDPMTDLPTAWLLGGYKWWHNSAQTMAGLDRELLSRHLAFHATWIARMLSLREAHRDQVLSVAMQLARKHVEAESARPQWRLEREEARLRDFARVWSDLNLEHQLASLRIASERQAPRQASKSDPIRDVWAASIIPHRIAPCSAHDQAAVPKEKRIDLPEHAIYGPFVGLVAQADGRKTLRELIEYTEWVYGKQFSTGEIKKYISIIEHLAQFGYLGVTYSQSIGKQDIVRALRETGLHGGDLILVHSSLSAFGHIEGGADTVIDAFLEVLGPRGTLLMPTFTQSAIYCDGQWITSKGYRPFNVAKTETWTGRISATFCQRPGILRSVHPTHSVAGCGPLAKACLADHREADPPTCRRSPLGKLVDHKGKLVWFGADLATATFLHFLEDEMDLPYLKPALCRVVRPDGTIESVHVPKWLPGHREFYKFPGESTKMFGRLIEKGLAIRSATLGLGQVRSIDAVQMYDLGMAALKADPNLLLCENPECAFCRTHTQPRSRSAPAVLVSR